MTLDEAISHSLEVAKDTDDCSGCWMDHLQLAAWLQELKDRRASDQNCEGDQCG